MKDLVAIAGLPLGAGSQLRSDAPPEPYDAWVVAAVRAAGGILIGTTAPHELAFGVTGVNDVTGFPPHPSDPSRIPGGSSSGSAVAVAEGSARLAIGTDTGGSVRIPAALCGVVGFKPAYGTYPLHGVFPLAPTLDHLGVHARTVREAVVAHATFTGRSVRARPATRIGLDRRALDEAEPEVAAAVTRVLPLLERAGCHVVDVDWPEPERIFEVSTAIMFAEAAAVHHRRLVEDQSIFGRDVAARLVTGSSLDATTYVAARRHRDVLVAEVARVLEGFDCILGPTVPVVAPTIAEVRKRPQLAARLVSHTRLPNLAGVPALTMPLPAEGLPVGAQLVGPHNEGLLATARFLEHLVAFELIGLGRRRHPT